MPQPRKDSATGYWLLSQRVPRQLTHLRGTKITLPIGDLDKTITLNDMVRVSLQTKDTREAKQRFAIADAALRLTWENELAKLREAPRPTRPQIALVRSPQIGMAITPLAAPLSLITTNINVALGGGQDTVIAPTRLRSSDHISVDDLFSRWRTYYADKRAASTIRRYKPAIESFSEFFGDRPI